MKFTAGILALCALASPAAAFVVKSPASPSFALNAKGEQVGAGQGVGQAVKGPAAALAKAANTGANVWESLTPIKVQGGSLKTWSFATPDVERVQVLLKTDGRPLNSIVELWQGPDNTPQKMGVYIEDGSKRNFRCVIETPRAQNAVCIRNTGQMEFPLAASVEAEVGDSQVKNSNNVPETIQGGALKTYSFAPAVQSVRVFLQTDTRPLNARIELLQGPNNNKQIVELYTEDGYERPFSAIIDTPGTGNVVRILNTAPVEFPLMALVEPYLVTEGKGVTVSDGGPGGKSDGQFFDL